MLKNLGKIKLFLIVAAIFAGAAVFVSAPFSNKQTDSSAYTDEAANMITENGVSIEDEEVALGIPGTAKTVKINWAVIGVTVAVINVTGVLIVIIISGEEKA